MKAVMLSIKPKYCEFIASGKKTMEVRKTRPKLETPFKCYIYMTKSNLFGDRKAYKDRLAGKVIGEFVCDGIILMADSGVYFASITDYDVTGCCLNYRELHKYGNGKNLYGWHISDLVIYDKPKELSEFRQYNIPSFEELKESNIKILCENCYRTDYGEKGVDCIITNHFNSYECDMGDCVKAYENYIWDNFGLTHPPQSWCYVEV